MEANRSIGKNISKIRGRVDRVWEKFKWVLAAKVWHPTEQVTESKLKP